MTGCEWVFIKRHHQVPERVRAVVVAVRLDDIEASTLVDESFELALEVGQHLTLISRPVAPGLLAKEWTI